MRSPLAVAVAGTAQVAVSFGLARYAYGMFLPEIGETFDLPLSVLGTIAGATYAGYAGGVVASGVATARWGSRAPVLVGGVTGVAGLALAAWASGPMLFAIGVVLAGSSAGWVWAPYSDIVHGLSVGEAASARALAAISTGTSFGLAGLALCLLLAPQAPWQVVWTGFAAVMVVVIVLNAVVLPRPSAGGTRPARGVVSESPWYRGMVVPVLFGMLSVGSGSVYFTYATSLVPSPTVAALVYLVLGAAGTLALMTGGVMARYGPGWTALGGLVVTALGIGLLAGSRADPVVVVVSAAVFGLGYMPCSALLALWTARVTSVSPTTSLTVAVFCAGLSAAGFPPLAGWLASTSSLEVALLVVAGVTVMGALGFVPRGDRGTAGWER